MPSQSKRIRNILYIIWQNNGAKGDFEDYYIKVTNKIIDKLKEKI